MSLLAALLPSIASHSFNNTKCPAPQEVQAPGMYGFKLDDIAGYYYELALHDVTQYPLCPSKPACITSNKTIRTHSDGNQFVHGEFSLSCLGNAYSKTLLFNVTSTPGFLRGYLPRSDIPFLPAGLADRVVFPDTVIDYKPGPDGWVLEFQCVEFAGRVVFTGVNLYAKHASDEAAFRAMLTAVKESGIDYYTQQGFGLTNVSQSAC